MALTRNQGISYLLCDDGIEVVLLQIGDYRIKHPLPVRVESVPNGRT